MPAAAPAAPAAAAVSRKSLSCTPPLLQNRYLIILYYNATRHKGKLSLKEQEAELRRMQEKHGVDGEQRPAGKK